MTSGIINTDKAKCKGCYACVRDCPAKAIKVEDGLAQVIAERCIACGNCLEVCATGAKSVESDVSAVWQLLAEHPMVIAVLSSSSPAALPHVHPRQLVTALKKLGFKEVMEDSFGAELVAREYARLLKSSRDRSILSSNCPAVVTYIEKYYPQLIGNLAPIVSPTIASGRLIKQYYNRGAKVVFIGPCVAKKAEAKYSKSSAIDAVLTFAELKDMFAAKGISPEKEERGQFSGPKPNMGRLFAIAGGLLKVMDVADDILLNDVISAHGREYVVKMLREFDQGNIAARFVNLYFCHGCIGGPVIRNDLSGFRRKQLVATYAQSEADPAQTERDLATYSGVDVSCEFIPLQTVGLTLPSSEEITRVLQQMGRARTEEQFNCGACGYATCRDLAIAVCRGLAEISMCWPYVLKKLKDTQEGLIQAEKLTSLGQMAASIAHEVNNPLTGVLVYTQLLEKKLNSGNFTKEIAQEYLTKMEAELTRSSRLIRNLLDFARQSPPALREVDLNQVMSRAFDLAAHSAELKHVRTVKDLAPTLPTIMADFDQLQQVLTNLIMNAVQAMAEEGGVLQLRTSANDGQLKVEVEDNGSGITPENMRKLFTPFFTTKREVKGVGLGLAVAYGIIQRHKGKIEVTSKEGAGTTFTIYLPLKHE